MPQTNSPQTQQHKVFALHKTPSEMNLSNIFDDRSGTYLNELTLFVAHFNTIPNFINEVNINCKKANYWFIETYRNEIIDYHFIKRYHRNENRKAEFDDTFYILYDDLIVDFDAAESTVRFLFRETAIEKVECIIKEIKKFKERKARRVPEICLIVSSTRGIDTTSFEITKPKLSIDDNYNDNFKVVHETILKRLSTKNDKGLVLLHGKPGTGKTSYIRYLISLLKKDVIFLPPNMAGAITSPGLISILINNPNSIFVIEDAENIVVDREIDGGSPVSALLNISDGLLSDCLNIQIICSFNTDLSKVDNALMRKGRLIAKYEFKELETAKARRLSQKLGFITSINSPMALMSIYNQDDKDFTNVKSRNQIGFSAGDNG